MLEWDKMMNLNVRASFQLISLATPFLKQSQNPASITVLSSNAGLVPMPGSIIFSTSMAMVNMLVKNTALEVASQGIRCNAVAPGVTKTAARENKESNFWEDLPENLKLDRDRGENEVRKLNQRYLEEAKKDVPLISRERVHQINDPADVAKAMLWLGSEDASFVTGEILTIDGGQSLTTNSFPDYIPKLERAMKE